MRSIYEHRSTAQNGTVYLADSLGDLLAEHVAAYCTTDKNQWLVAGEVDGSPHQSTVGCW